MFSQFMELWVLHCWPIFSHRLHNFGIASISAASGGISTVTNPVFSFPGIVTTGNLVRYSDPTGSFPSLARVTDVQTSQISIAPVQTVTAFIDGSLPTSNLSVTDFEVVEARVQRNSVSSGNPSDNQSLFSAFPKKMIQNVDLTKTNLVIRRQFDVQITDGSTPWQIPVKYFYHSMKKDIV